VLGTVQYATPAEVDATVNSARAAWMQWRGVPARERSQILLTFRSLLLRDLEPLAHSVARECGKTLAEAQAELLKGIEVLEFAAALHNSDLGGSVEVSRGVTCEYRREPLGVTVGITPFNFPAMVPMWMIPITIALGNVFILKPSEKVPFTPVMLAELLREAGLPQGVFSVLQGGRAVVEQLIQHTGVDAVAFVGSSSVARSVYGAATNTGKRALCLGSAKNHLIVAPDADERLTVEGVVASFTGCAGQRCMAGSVLVAVGSAHSLVPHVVAAASRIALGSDMGALIDGAAVARLHAAIDDASKAGAQILLDGRMSAPPGGYEAGCWLGPTILKVSDASLACVQRELFGPVLTVVCVETLDQALQLEARTPYGNATVVFTQNGAVARTVGERAGAGMIGVNVGVPVPREPFSFGGRKESKFGSGEITGGGAVEFWSDRKKITTKWAAHSDRSWMS
jgi:malonate-semialdehyde dehydrogenase (acetylating)/methylmalonate-semialdehyde dehydrogenase